MARIFGLDIGSTSIGSAVIDYDRAQGTGAILHMGTRIFPEARDPDGTPLNQTRRQKRMARRQLHRRRNRRRTLNECLAEVDLLPPFCRHVARRQEDETDPWHVLMRRDPVALRHHGLAEKLDLHDFGRALYHLAQRRHFKGRDLEDEEDTLDSAGAAPRKGTKAKGTPAHDKGAQSADEKAAQANRESTLAALKASGQTLGQYLFTIAPDNHLRGIHANRAAVSDEFNRLWDAQAAHHAALRDPALRAQIENTIFAQRPVFWRKSTLGKCRFMPGEALCPKGSWLSQQRRMLEKLNNLALAGGNARPLEEEERKAILKKLQTQASMSWGAVRTALKSLCKARGEVGAERSFKFNLELDEGETLLGNPLEAKLAGIFGDDWAAHPHRQDIRDAIHERLWAADYGEVGRQRVVIRRTAERRERRADAVRTFVADFGITDDQAAALAALKLPTGWEPFSIAALRQFMPHLEDGIRLGALINGPNWQSWREQTFPQRAQPTGQILDRLPSPTKKHPEEMNRIATVRNPTVVRVQNELRKVVNNLISLYGKPDLIRVELTREVGKSKREREEMQAGQRRQEKRRRNAATDLRDKGIEPHGRVSRNGCCGRNAESLIPTPDARSPSMPCSGQPSSTSSTSGRAANASTTASPTRRCA
jgi:CRISPR-associated endonuclease Csn1